MIEHKPWGVSLREEQHEGIVSYETFLKIQDLIEGRSHAPARKDLNKDFPLRSAVACECSNHLTAAWSKSRSGKLHPYYVCQNRKCDYKGKSIRRKRSQAARMAALKKDEANLDRDIEQLLDRIVQTDSAGVSKALEKPLEGLEAKTLVLAEKQAANATPKRPFEQMYRTAMEFLANPYKFWACGGLAEQRAVLKLAFSKPLIWDRKGQYRTPELSLPFKVLGVFLMLGNKMVPGPHSKYSITN